MLTVCQFGQIMEMPLVENSEYEDSVYVYSYLYFSAGTSALKVS